MGAGLNNGQNAVDFVTFVLLADPHLGKLLKEVLTKITVGLSLSETEEKSLIKWTYLANEPLFSQDASFVKVVFDHVEELRVIGGGDVDQPLGNLPFVQTSWVVLAEKT